MLELGPLGYKERFPSASQLPLCPQSQPRAGSRCVACQGEQQKELLQIRGEGGPLISSLLAAQMRPRRWAVMEEISLHKEPWREKVSTTR